MLSSNEGESYTVEQRANRTRIKNRRLRWLEKHPEYFSDASREIAGVTPCTDPLLYDRLVRRWMTPEERERQTQQREFAGALEATFTRSEAKIEALEHPDPDDPVVYVRGTNGTITAVEQDEDSRASSKEVAWKRWTDMITEKFVQGADQDFDYASVDDSEGNDDKAEEDRIELENYIDVEEETFLGEGSPRGQTGVQDF